MRINLCNMQFLAGTMPTSSTLAGFPPSFPEASTFFSTLCNDPWTPDLGPKHSLLLCLSVHSAVSSPIFPKLKRVASKNRCLGHHWKPPYLLADGPMRHRSNMVPLPHCQTHPHPLLNNRSKGCPWSADFWALHGMSYAVVCPGDLQEACTLQN